MADKEKIELMEELAAHHMEASNLSPLTANIYAYILLSCNKDGLTFNELVDTFQASKSSVSKSLNLLLQYEYITQFNKIGERKRRYKITSQHVIIQMKKIKTRLMREKTLSEKLINYHKSNSEGRTFIEGERAKILSDHLNETISRLTKTIDKIENLTN